MRRRIVVAALVAVFFAWGGGQAPVLGNVVFGNLGASGTNGFNTLVANPIGLNGARNTAVATAFTTGPGASWELTQIQLALGTPDVAPVARIRITADSGGSPTFTSLGELTTTAITSNALYTFTPTSSVVLSGNTKYWFTVYDQTGPSEGSSFTWYANAAGVFPSGQNASGFTYPAPDATKENRNFDENGPWFVYDAGRTAAFSLAVAPVPVPEPSTIALGLIGLMLGTGLLGRRRLSRRA